MIKKINIFIMEFIFILILVYFNTYKTKAINLNIAVSANFAAPLNSIKNIFEQKYNCTLTLCIDSTTNLYTKIINGAPFDIFLSADTMHPKLLEKKNLTIKKITYAKGKLVLWIPIIMKSIKKTFIYNHSCLLATANPKLSPYGNATKNVLKNINIKTKNIYGSNINQIYNFINTKNCKLGFIALSQVLLNDVNPKTYWIIPEYLSPKIQQDAIIIKHTQYPTLSEKFFIFLKKKKIKNLLYSYGYETN